MIRMKPPQEWLDKERRLAICIPCLDKPHMRFSQCLGILMFRLGVMRYPVILIHESGSLISKVRNRLIDNMLRIEKEQNIVFEHVLMLDSDMMFPGDVYFKMKAFDKDIVGCTYLRRSPPYEPMGITTERKPREVGEQTMIEMDALPTGMLLIKRSVFDQIKRPYFTVPFREESEIGARDDMEWGEDFAFSAKCRAAGIQLYLDVQTSKEIGHVAEQVIYTETHAMRGPHDGTPIDGNGTNGNAGRAQTAGAA